MCSLLTPALCSSHSASLSIHNKNVGEKQTKQTLPARAGVTIVHIESQHQKIKAKQSGMEPEPKRTETNMAILAFFHPPFQARKETGLSLTFTFQMPKALVWCGFCLGGGFGYTSWHVGSRSLTRDWTWVPRKHRILTAELPGKSLIWFLWIWHSCSKDLFHHEWANCKTSNFVAFYFEELCFLFDKPDVLCKFTC